jgi:hypothetical protein
MKIYVNGILSNTDSTGVNAAVSAQIASIGSYANATSFFNGTLDDVRVYNRALSASEVKQIYNEGTGAKVNASTQTTQGSGSLSQGLVGLWTMDGADTTDKIYDRSGNNNNGYFNSGTATSSAKTIGKLGQALKFSGSQYVTTGYTIPAQSSATSFTWSAWAKVGSGNGCCSVIMGFRNGATWVKLTPTKFEYVDGAGGISYTIPTGQWVHIVVVKNGSSLTYYANNAVVGTATNSSSAASQTMYFGEDRRSLAGRDPDQSVGALQPGQVAACQNL